MTDKIPHVPKSFEKRCKQKLANDMAFVCVRLAGIEKFHEGKNPVSKTGDFSDVKVVTPDREIPWNEVSRIGQEEMKTLMKSVANRIYTFLLHLEDQAYMEYLHKHTSACIYMWDAPEETPLEKYFNGDFSEPPEA